MCNTDVKKGPLPWDIKDHEIDVDDVSLVDIQSVGGKPVNVSVGNTDGDLGLQLEQARKAL